MDTPQKEIPTIYDFVPREVVPLELVKLMDVRSPKTEVTQNVS